MFLGSFGIISTMLIHLCYFAGHYRDLEKYFECVCAQVLQLLQETDSSLGYMKEIGASCIRALLERSLVLSRRYLLNLIMQPLITMAEENFRAAKVRISINT